MNINPIDKDFAVAYSGGLDSTFVPFVMGKRYSQGRAHLLTVQQGHGHILPWLAKIHVKDLKQHLGEGRVIHNYEYTKRAFRRMVLNTLVSDYCKYGHSNFVVCMGCIMAMAVHIITYCLENMVPMVFFGFTPRGSDFAVMSLPETCYELRQIYAKFGLIYRIPIVEWHMEKPEERAILRSYGIWPGWNFRKIAMGVQPPCLLGVTMHHMDIFFDIHPTLNRNDVVAFIRDKAPLLEHLVEERLRRRGFTDMRERIAKVRELNESEWAKYGPQGPLLDDMAERKMTADMTGISIIADKSFPNTVPLYDHPTLSRDGRWLPNLTQ